MLSLQAYWDMEKRYPTIYVVMSCDLFLKLLTLTHFQECVRWCKEVQMLKSQAMVTGTMWKHFFVYVLKNVMQLMKLWCHSRGNPIHVSICQQKLINEPHTTLFYSQHFCSLLMAPFWLLYNKTKYSCVELYIFFAPSRICLTVLHVTTAGGVKEQRFTKFKL